MYPPQDWSPWGAATGFNLFDFLFLVVRKHEVIGERGEKGLSRVLGGGGGAGGGGQGEAQCDNKLSFPTLSGPKLDSGLRNKFETSCELPLEVNERAGEGRIIGETLKLAKPSCIYIYIPFYIYIYIFHLSCPIYHVRLLISRFFAMYTGWYV